MGRRALLFLPLLALALAGCALPGTDAAEIGNCEEDVAELWTEPADAKDWDARVHRVCEGLVKAGLEDDSSEADFFAVLRENRSLSAELCELSTEGLLGDGLSDPVLARFGGYVTREEALRLGHDGCVYALTEGYGSFSTGLNATALYQAHPYLVAPFCRASMMQAYDYDPPPQPRRLYEEVMTDVCMEGIRTRVVDYSSGDFANPRIDQRAFRALLKAEWAKAR